MPERFFCEAGALTDVYLKQRLEKHAEEREVFDSFRDALGELSVSLATNISEQADGDKETPPPRRPLIFIIDELDRCKPTYALELLEKIKHFFSVEGVHFVLVTHLKQLENSVCYGYGLEKTNAGTYLQKYLS